MSQAPFGLCLEACECAESGVIVAECPYSNCEDGKVPSCWTLTLSTSMTIDGVDISGEYTLSRSGYPQAGYCMWGYFAICSTGPPTGCLRFALGIGSYGGGAQGAHLWIIPTGYWGAGYSETGSDLAYVTENAPDFTLSLSADSDCLTELTLTGATGTAVITPKTGGCNYNWDDFWDWWDSCRSGEGNTCWTCRNHSLGCVPSSMVVTLDNIEPTAYYSGCVIEGEYELPLQDFPSVAFGICQYGLGVLIEGTTHNLLLTIEAHVSEFGLTVSLTPWVDYSKDHAISLAVSGSPVDLGDVSWTGDWGTDIYYEDGNYFVVDDGQPGITIESGDSCAPVDGGPYYVPATTAVECEPCGEDNSASICWYLVIDGTTYTFDNGTELDGLQCVLVIAEDSCTWHQWVSCYGVPGACFFVELTITLDGSDADFELTVYAEGTTPGSGRNNYRTFTGSTTAPANCINGEYELAESGGSGTATITALENQGCLYDPGAHFRCMMDDGGGNIFPACMGCEPSSYVVTLSNVVCGGMGSGTVAGEYELWKSGAQWGCEYTGVFTICGYSVTMTFSNAVLYSGTWYRVFEMTYSPYGTPQTLAYVYIQKASDDECEDTITVDWLTTGSFTTDKAVDNLGPWEVTEDTTGITIEPGEGRC